MTALVVSVATFAMTLLGGWFALRFKDRLHLVLGFSAGAVLGVAFFDLIPEAIDLARPSLSTPVVLSMVMAGFVVYMMLDRAVASGSPPESVKVRLWQHGALGAASLSFHSFVDGFIIGLGFNVSTSIGIAVSVAVLAHDFSDGINTVGIVLGKQGDRRQAMRWLLLDAVAPVLGAAIAVNLHLRPELLGAVLALCSGFFLYISASDLLPESYHDHPTKLTTLMTLLGLLVLYLVSQLSAG